MKALVFVVLFGFIGIPVIEGAVFLDKVKIDVVEGRKVYYCEYKGLKLLPKSKIKDYEACQICTCTRKGLECKTYPYIPRSTRIPPDAACKPITVGCKSLWVRKDKTKKKCPKRLIPAISIVGK